MSNELEVYEGMKDMVVARPPEQVLAEDVLAWVVVLAGYRPTPAEEMHEAGNNRPPVAAPQKNGKKTYTVYTIFDENGEKYGTFDTNDTGAIVAIKYVTEVQ